MPIYSNSYVLMCTISSNTHTTPMSLYPAHRQYGDILCRVDEMSAHDEIKDRPQQRETRDTMRKPNQPINQASTAWGPPEQPNLGGVKENNTPQDQENRLPTATTLNRTHAVLCLEVDQASPPPPDPEDPENKALGTPKNN